MVDLRYTRTRYLNTRKLLHESLLQNIGCRIEDPYIDIRYIGALYYRIYYALTNETVFFSARSNRVVYSEYFNGEYTVQKTSNWSVLINKTSF